MKYYSFKNAIEKNTVYNFIIGERYAGKTFYKLENIENDCNKTDGSYREITQKE